MIGETILVIDTDTETIQKIVSTLESEDFLVFTAPSGEIGITMAKKVNPSVIFVNPALAGTSGLEVCKTIHGIETLKNVPIVVLSSFEGAMDPRYTTLYGIVDSLKKPFSPEELISKTKNVLSRKSVTARPAVEEYVEHVEPEEGIPAEEEMPWVQEEIEGADVSDRTVVKTREDIALSDKTVVKQAIKNIEEEKTEHMQIPREEPAEVMGERDRTYVLKKNIRRRGMGNRLIVPIIIAVVIVVLGAGGFVLYKKGLLPGTKVQKPVAVKPSQPVQQEAAKVTPPQEQQKPAQAVEGKPAPAATPAPKPATTPTPAPAATPVTPSKPEAKPAGRAIYHVQVGAFKNENNAASLTKQYKDKGYDAFTHKAQKDKEILYRVLIGKFENNKEAAKLAENISAKEKIKATIFKE